MTKFNVSDRVTIISGNPLWFDKEGIVTDVDDSGNVKVNVEFNSEDGDTKIITNVFPEDELESFNQNEALNKGVNTMNELKLNESELQQWMDDNDANYWDQDITDDNTVEIKGIHEVLGIYNFNTHTLKLTEGYLKETPYVEEYTEDPDDEDFIKDYVEYEDEKGRKISSWYFASKIATAEGIDEGCVYEVARKFGYKLYCIHAGETFDKLVIAGKGVKAEEIYDDYADYLAGKACVIEVK